MGCTFDAFRQFGNDQRVARISVTLNSENVQEDEDCEFVLSSIRDGHFTLQEVVFAVIVDGQHRNVAIGEHRKDMAEECN